MIHRLIALFDRRPMTAEDWLARLWRPGADASQQAGFQAWLEQDVDHLNQYEAAKADLAALEPLRGVFAEDLSRIGARSRVAAPTGRRLVMATGLAAVVAGGLFFWSVVRPTSEGRLYESAPGQILDVVLADGSNVTLDAGSAIRVAMDGDARRVSLVRGGAYFDVAHDAGHSFQVAVADQRVIVTGTRFATILRRDHAEVSLLEGRVAIGRHDVRSRNALVNAVRLTPGDRATFTPGGEVVVAPADVEAMTAWRQRRLIFQDATIADVVAEASRYVDGDLVIVDPAVAGITVTAVLPLNGAGALIDRMDRLFPIAVERAPDGRILIRAE